MTAVASLRSDQTNWKERKGDLSTSYPYRLAVARFSLAPSPAAPTATAVHRQRTSTDALRGAALVRFVRPTTRDIAGYIDVGQALTQVPLKGCTKKSGRGLLGPPAPFSNSVRLFGAEQHRPADGRCAPSPAAAVRSLWLARKGPYCIHRDLSEHHVFALGALTEEVGDHGTALKLDVAEVVRSE